MNERNILISENEENTEIMSQINAILEAITDEYNNLPRMIDIGMTIAVAMGVKDPDQIKFSEDIVAARIAAGITDQDIERLRTFGIWDYPSKQDFSQEDIDWLKSYAEKTQMTYENLISNGYDRKTIRG